MEDQMPEIAERIRGVMANRLVEHRERTGEEA
jgi:hypothetical protein